jgi:hypothetical protein
MKTVRWAAAAITILMSLMNVPIAFGGSSDEARPGSRGRSPPSASPRWEQPSPSSATSAGHLRPSSPLVP